MGVMSRRRRRALLGGASYASTLQSFVDAGTLPLWLRFRETSGTTAANAGSSGATLNATWTPGVGSVGQTGKLGANEAYLYDALNSKATIADATSIASAAVFTQAVLIRPATAGESNSGAFMYWDSNTQAYFKIDSNLNAVNVRVDTDATSANTLGTLTLAANTWQWVFATYDNAGDRKLRLYKGVGGAVTEATAYGAQTAATGNLIAQGTALVIGNRSANDNTFDGLFDEALRFNIVLSSAQMLQIVQQSGA